MTTALLFLSVLFPVKGWFGPDQAWNVTIKPPAGTTVRLVLTDFSGSALDPEPTQKREFDKEGMADIKLGFPAIATAGTYLLYAAPKEAGTQAHFAGEPLGITERGHGRRGGP